MGVPSRALERLQLRLLPENVKQTSNKKKTSEMTSSEYARTSKPMLEICHCETQTYKNEIGTSQAEYFSDFWKERTGVTGKEKNKKQNTNYTDLSSSTYFKAHNSFTMKQNTKSCWPGRLRDCGLKEKASDRYCVSPSPQTKAKSEVFESLSSLQFIFCSEWCRLRGNPPACPDTQHTPIQLKVKTKSINP